MVAIIIKKATKRKTDETPYWTAKTPPAPEAIEPTPKLRKNEKPYPIPLDEDEVYSAIIAFPIGCYIKWTNPNNIPVIKIIRPEP